MGAAVAIGAALWLGAAPAPAQLERADPLLIPTGPLPGPGDLAARSARERLEVAARTLRERGHDQLPFVAWALIQISRREGDASLARQAVELAPDTPGVWLEAARVSRSLELGLGGLASLARSFPALLWLLGAGGAALGGALLGTVVLLQLLAAARGMPLAAHAIAHLARLNAFAAWPGVLAGLGALALLAACGAGPLTLVALAGCAGALFLRPAESTASAIALIAAGLVLGPGVDLWARAAVAFAHDGPIAAAWRVERGHALPGDRTLLERALERRPGDALVRVALATDRLREGDGEGALALLAEVEADEAELRAVLANLRGTLQLARGEVGLAIAELEQAHSLDESVAVLFNLSQAYGRALRLEDQAPAYNAARALDPEAVARFGREARSTVHDFLMPVRVPSRLFLRRVLAPSSEAARLARDLRARLIGRGLPEAAWMGLPLLGLVCAGLRRTTVARCERCERLLCAHCSPESLNQTTCVRCVRLFESRQNVDPRVRQEQLALDRRRQRRLARLGACAALLAPGVGALRRGRWIAGWTRLGCVALGAALLLVPRWIAPPWEVGPVGPWTALAGAGLLAAAYLRALLEALRVLAGREARA